MATQCDADTIRLTGLGHRDVVCNFDGGPMSSDGRAVPMQFANHAFGSAGARRTALSANAIRRVSSSLWRA